MSTIIKPEKNGMRPIHPGEVLREEYLVPLKLSKAALATALRVTDGRIEELVDERIGVTADIALRVARYFGGDAQSWLNLQRSYDLKIAEKEIGSRLDEIEPIKRKQVPLRGDPGSGE